MKYKILLTLFTISLVFSILLAVTPTDQLCGEETSSCSIVQNSDYTNTLGINNAILGITAFTILIITTLLHIKYPKRKTKIFLAITLLFSTIGAIHFIYLQLFIIKALCPYCMTIDIATIAALIILITKNEN
ncbi:MAG: vitamin K epoxide reductase family protein [archaeon]